MVSDFDTFTVGRLTLTPTLTLDPTLSLALALLSLTFTLTPSLTLARWAAVGSDTMRRRRSRWRCS